jgi:acyl-CoA synthetase (AMP-forming)/AMP-acid ligase II/thioesterase domain-containing protein/NADP-dependent 3-hydroxy acid dehydrogenase YdfG/acyl carrier protein
MKNINKNITALSTAKRTQPKLESQKKSDHLNKQPTIAQRIDEDIKNKQIVEASLLKSPWIDECVVLIREGEASQREIVAYLVSANSFSLEQLESHLRVTLPAALIPNAYVLVSTLPLTDQGLVDEQALANLEVIDSELVQRWEKQLRSQPEIEQVAVVREEYTEKILPLHLKDILPNWKVTNNSTLQSNKIIPQVSTTKSDILAISHGEPLQLPIDAPKNLAEVLLKAATEASEKGIVYIDSNGCETIQSYQTLLEEAQQLLAGLRKLNLQPQDKVIFLLNESHDFIPAFWGCILGGFVPVPITTASNYDDPSDSNVKKLQNAWQILDRPLVLTKDSIAPQVRKLLSQLNLENFFVQTVEDLRANEQEKNWHCSQPDDLALLLLTSGSTGIPKGVTLTHHNIISSVAGTSQMHNLSSQDISLNWLPLDHPGPLIRCVIRCIYLGCQQIHASTTIVLQDILTWLNWIERYRVTTTWAPNFAFALLSDRAEDIKKRRWDLSSVKSFLNTAEPIVPQTARRVLELLSPHGLTAHSMHSSWGMAETSSGVTLSDRYLLESPLPQYSSFAELGFPITGTSLRIVNDKNEVVNEQTIGYLQVKGSTVTPGYYHNLELNREAFTEDGWLKTGDLGFLQEGRLTITGRTKNIIIINGVNYYSHGIEEVVEAVKGVEVSYTAACATRQPGNNTDELIVFFHTLVSDENSLVELLKEIRRNIVSKIGIKPDYLIPVEKQAIPKTSIGKIQHAQLKKRFESGDFDAILKRIDILLGNQNTLPDWFYRQIWRRKEIVCFETQLTTGLTLVFLDSLGLGDFLCAELEKLGRSYIGVEIGSNFANLTHNRYCIAPENSSHYEQLIESISTEKLPITQILHLWTYDEYLGEISDVEMLKQAQERGAYSLLFLIQALNRIQGSDTPVRLQVIASYSQVISTQEKIACERSPIIGVVKTIPQELTWIDCCHLDLPVQDNKVNAAYILHELQVIQQEKEVAYRNGQRLVSRIEKVDFTKEEKQDLPFREGGVYLITGGLGGIGSEIAKYLLQNYQARLVLIGRTPLPERSTWEKHLHQGETVSERIKTYLSLEQLGGDIIYEAVDICNLSELQQTVERICHNWQCDLDGVIHLAGTIETRLLLEETVDSFASTLRPKVFGTWTLHQLIKNKTGSVFISFSSVNGFFGRMQAGAYSAANRFLDSFSQYQKNLGSLQSYCFAWSMWDETGLSRNYQMKDLNRARGYSIISHEQGQHSFLVGLRYKPGYLLIGLDGTKKYIQQCQEMELYQTQKLSAYFTAKTTALSQQLQELEVRDHFGTQSTCEFHQLQHIPLTNTGEIDLKQLIDTGLQPTANYVAPRNETEERLVSIWQQVLNVPQVGIHDNFFELGGTSILAVRLFSKIEHFFGKNLPLASLFPSGTIEALAKTIIRAEELDKIQTQSKTWSSLVEIQPKGSKPPLFCIHPLGGEILCYRPLALRLGLDQPVYGLQPIGLDGQQSPLTRIEDMAAHYIREIKTIQPDGPYYFAGYSLGGLIAYEMAQQLYQQGEKVGLLAMLDMVRPGSETRSPFIMRVLEHIQNLFQQGPSYLIKKLTGWSEWGLYHIRDKYKRVLEKSEILPDGDKHLGIMDANIQALNQYNFQPYPSHMVLLRTADKKRDKSVGMRYDSLFGWGELVAGGLDVYHIPGSHLSLLDEPDVKVLAEKLKDCLEQAHNNQ